MLSKHGRPAFESPVLLDLAAKWAREKVREALATVETARPGPGWNLAATARTGR
jgi:hypothetical protein